MAGACDEHLAMIRLYLSEFGPCESVDPSVMLEVANALRLNLGLADRKVLLLDHV